MRIGSLNLPHDQLVRAYTDHYQHGSGVLPAFAGTVYQDGSGFGDVLRGIFRSILPVFASGATSFLRGASEGLTSGKNLRDSALGALAPAVSSAVGTAISKVQGGKGRRKRKAHRKHKARHLKKAMRVYKRKHAPHTKKRHHKKRKLLINPLNF